MNAEIVAIDTRRRTITVRMPILPDVTVGATVAVMDARPHRETVQMQGFMRRAKREEASCPKPE